MLSDLFTVLYSSGVLSLSLQKEQRLQVDHPSANILSSHRIYKHLGMSECTNNIYNPRKKRSYLTNKDNIFDVPPLSICNSTFLFTLSSRIVSSFRNCVMTCNEFHKAIKLQQIDQKVDTASNNNYKLHEDMKSPCLCSFQARESNS